MRGNLNGFLGAWFAGRERTERAEMGDELGAAMEQARANREQLERALVECGEHTASILHIRALNARLHDANNAHSDADKVNEIRDLNARITALEGCLDDMGNDFVKLVSC